MVFGHQSRLIYVLLLIQWCYYGDIVLMQDSAPYSTHRAKATQDDLRNAVPDFAVTE